MQCWTSKELERVTATKIYDAKSRSKQLKTSNFLRQTNKQCGL